MVSRFFPLGINIAFEQRPYKLGETIHLTVKLVPRRDIRVREVRVDLVCEIRRIKVPTVQVRRPLPSGLPVAIPTSSAHRRVSETYTDAYVQGSAVFLQGGRLLSGRTSRHNVGLKIQPELPTRQSEGMRWRLVTTAEVVGGRHITARRTVNVAT